MFTSFTVWGIVVMSYGFFVPNSWKRATAIIVPAVLTPLVTTLVLCSVNSGVAVLTDFKTVITCTLTTAFLDLLRSMARDHFGGTRV